MSQQPMLNVNSCLHGFKNSGIFLNAPKGGIRPVLLLKGRKNWKVLGFSEIIETSRAGALFKKVLATIEKWFLA